MARTISLRSTKEAALYFEQVLPFDGVTALSDGLIEPSKASSQECLPYYDLELSVRVMRSLLPDVSNPKGVFNPLLSLQAGIVNCRANNDPSAVLKQQLKDFSAALQEYHGISIEPLEFVQNPEIPRKKLDRALSSYLSTLGFDRCSTWAPGVPFGGKEETGDERFEVVIQNLHLVDATKLTWEQIIEFRRDDESAKSLRDLRLFFSENFQGKDRGYIEDKLTQLVERQESAARLWKLETVQKSFAVAFTNQSALASSVAGLATTVGGAPLAIVAGAALAFPIGSCALEFSKVLIDAKKEKVDRPTRFLTKLKKLGTSAAREI